MHGCPWSSCAPTTHGLHAPCLLRLRVLFVTHPTPHLPNLSYAAFARVWTCHSPPLSSSIACSSTTATRSACTWWPTLLASPPRGRVGQPTEACRQPILDPVTYPALPEAALDMHVLHAPAQMTVRRFTDAVLGESFPLRFLQQTDVESRSPTIHNRTQQPAQWCGLIRTHVQPPPVPHKAPVLVPTHARLYAVSA